MMRARFRPPLMLCAALFCLTAYDVRAGVKAVAEKQPGPAASLALVDKPIAGFQGALLDLAFDTATAIPIHPHVKDRSRAQEAVVAVCLELDQPQRAQGYVARIDNWRRGAGYADLAFYWDRQGKTPEAQHYLDLAAQVAHTPGVEDWRRDRLQVTIAKTHTWLGQSRPAEQLTTGVTESETSKVDGVKAMLSNEDSFTAQVKALDGLLGSGHFDIIKNALDAYAELFNRFYSDLPRRAQVEEKIKAALSNRPVLFRVDLLMKLARFALEHADQAKALALVQEAQALAAHYQLPPRYGLPLMARLAALRFRAGDSQQARTDADTTLARFEAARETMVDIDRAGALRPLGEAYQAMGDHAAALAIYKRAVEEGVRNPNSRPRAEDLSATCRSMAVHGVEPDALLWTRMRQIRQGLGTPW